MDVHAVSDLPGMRQTAPVSVSPDGPRVSRRAAPGLVFVDEAGRRARWLSRTGTLLGAVMVLYLVAVGGSFAGAAWVPRLPLPGVGVVVPGAGSHVKLALPTTQAPGLVSPPATLGGSGAGPTQGATDHGHGPGQGQAPAPAQVAAVASSSASAATAPFAASSNPGRSTSATTVAPVPPTTPSGKTPPGQLHKSSPNTPGVTAPGRTKH